MAGKHIDTTSNDGPKLNPAATTPRRLELSESIEPLSVPSWFVQRCADFGVECEANDLRRFGQYLALLAAANEVMNLTTVRDADAAWEKHIFDSLTLLPLLASAEVHRVIDIGSGGGVPGLPLAIAMPGVSFTLVEATGKKAQFLELAVSRLGLTNVVVVSERAEVVGRDRETHRDQYDAAIVRAVGHLAIVAELCIPLVRVDGFVLAVKGEKAAAEVEESAEALRMLHSEVAQIVATPTGRVVVLHKLRPTPKLYPRRPGEPKRAPLGMSKKP